MLKYIFLVFALAAYTTGQTADYCSPALCSGSQHIGCGNNGAFAPTCSTDREIIPIGPYIDLILSMHNADRNKIAAGQVPGFDPASRMATMLWDSESAYLAELNVKQCAMKHDQCRNTASFKWAGQNLATYYSMPAATPTTAIETGINSWFNEYKDATMDDIRSFKQSSLVAGHFTAMVNDRSIRTGCALARQTASNGLTQYLFACNYAQTNILGYQIYTSGPAASRCSSVNPNYPALCSETELIDPNTF